MKIKLLNKINVQYVDVLIIGGNLTGLSTALNLDSNLKIMIVDKSFIGNKLANAIQILNINNFNCQTISNIFPLKYVKMYSDFLAETIDIIKNNVIKNNIKCNLNVKEVSETEDINYFSNLSYKNIKTMFNLKKYVLGLKKQCLQKNIIIKECTKVLNVRKNKGKYKCKTNKGIIIASKVVVACHDFNNLLPLSSFLKVYKCNNKLFTNDGLPYIGCFKAGDNTLLVSYGYNNYVVQNGILASSILSDLIMEKENSLVPLLSPNRHTNIYNFKNISINVFNNLKNFINNNIIFNKMNVKPISIALKKRNINFPSVGLVLKERVK